MTNSWALLYDELYGEDKMNEDSIQIGTGGTGSAGDFYTGYDGYDTVHVDLGNVNITGVDQEVTTHIGIRPETERKSDYRYKYHEHEIIKDIEQYVSGTYNGHYTGTKFEYRNVQTLDLMAARDLASDFCQANILKYGSRYGSKDGKNRKDLMKVIHYAMLLLHFDEHYGKPKFTSGNIDHTMP